MAADKMPIDEMALDKMACHHKNRTKLDKQKKTRIKSK